MTPFIIAGIIIAFLIFVLYMPLGVGAKYENGAFFIVKIAFFSFEIPVNRVIKPTKKKKKSEKKEKKPEEEIDKAVIGLDFILSLLGDFRRFVRARISLYKFDFAVTFGTADAASTAVLTGHMWSLVYNLLALVDKIVYVDNPKVNVTPVFNDATFSIKASGIIKTRLAHIIATAVVFAYKFLKYKRNKIRRTTK